MSTILGDQKIGESNYTISWLVKILNAHDNDWTFGDDVQVLTKQPKFVLISKDKGHAAQIYSIQLSVGERHYQIAAKIPDDFHRKEQFENLHRERKITKEKMEEEIRTNFQMISSVHNREWKFYETAKENFRDIHVPKFVYGEEMTHEQNGIILMEDFTDRCAKKFNNFKGLSKKQVFGIVEDLARIQFQSMNIPNLAKKFAFNPLLVEAVSNLVAINTNGILDRKLPWFTEELADMIVKSAQPENLIKLYAPEPDKYGVPAVLVHADLWPENMLWGNGAENEEAQMISIVDWQCCHVGSFTTDLSNLLCVSMTGETRREEEKAILQFFYENLKKHTQLIDLTFEQVEASYRKSQHYAVLPMVMTVFHNPHADLPADGEVEGILTKRLRLLLEDVYGK